MKDSLNERLNMRRLAPMERSPVPVFDAEKELTEKDIAEVREVMDLVNDTELEHPVQFMQLAALLKQVTGQETLFQDDVKNVLIEKYLKPANNEDASWINPYNFVTAREAGIDFYIDANTWSEFKNYLNTLSATGGAVATVSAYLKQLCAPGFSEWGIQEGDQEHFQKSLEVFRKTDFPGTFIWQARRMKILGMLPQGAVSEAEWEQMIRYARNLGAIVRTNGEQNLFIRREGWWNYLQVVAALKIIAATSVECTEHGLVIGSPQKTIPLHEVPPVPPDSHLP